MDWGGVFVWAYADAARNIPSIQKYRRVIFDICYLREEYSPYLLGEHLRPMKRRTNQVLT